MSERRPHWDDELLFAVMSAAGDGGHLFIDDIYAVIAAVEDWHLAKGTRSPLDVMGTLVEVEHSAAVQRVRELHTRTAETTYCAGCGRMWPCPTIRMIEEEL